MHLPEATISDHQLSLVHTPRSASARYAPARSAHARYASAARSASARYATLRIGSTLRIRTQYILKMLKYF